MNKSDRRVYRCVPLAIWAFGALAGSRRGSGGCLGPAAARRATDVRQGRRADSPAVVRHVPSAGAVGADVADDLRRRAAVGALDQDARGGPRDAAVAHRPERRHPEVQGRSVVERRRDRDDRRRGWTPARRAATRPTCRRSVSSPTPTSGRSASPIWSCASRRSRCRPSGRTCFPTLHRAARAHRRSLHQGDPDPAGERRRHGASCTTRRHDGGAGAATAATRTSRTAGRSSSSTRPARPRSCIRTTRGVLLKAGTRLNLGTTCTRSVKRSRRKSRSASCSIRRA